MRPNLLKSRGAVRNSETTQSEETCNLYSWSMCKFAQSEYAKSLNFRIYGFLQSTFAALVLNQSVEDE